MILSFSDSDRAFVNNMNAPNNNIPSAATYAAGNTNLLAGKLMGSSVAALDQTLLKVCAADGITHQISPDATEPSELGCVADDGEHGRHADATVRG